MNERGAYTVRPMLPDMDCNREFEEEEDIEEDFEEADARVDEAGEQNEYRVHHEEFVMPPQNTHVGHRRVRDVQPLAYMVDVESGHIRTEVESSLEGTRWHGVSEFGKGMIFNTKDDLIHSVRVHHAQTHHNFKVVQSTPTTWMVRGNEDETCVWWLRASQRKKHGLFEITQHKGPHTCINETLSQDHPQLKSSLVANEVVEIIKSDVGASIAALQAHLRSKYQYHVSYRKVWLEKQMAVSRVFGDWDISYQLLPKWMHAMCETNPGTKVKWAWTEILDANNVAILTCVFWSFATSIEGFRHCPPVLCVDGTHLYRKYKGKLLIAMAPDANQQIFPVAFAIVEEESLRIWSWFLKCIQDEVIDRNNLCLISDRHVGILAAVRQNDDWQPPRAHHRFCLRHIVRNFNQRVHNTMLKRMVEIASREHQVRKFNSMMERILTEGGPIAKSFFEEIPPHMWTQCHDGGRRYGNMTTNLVECFNAVLKGTRSLPITAIVQMIFYRVAQYFSTRREASRQAMESGNGYTPHM
ncbi:uncharacterized protein LOC131158630 [Malania oleifera]|uniref:uncharacterized protein LOC131158630 n=1 Tax=Malania oleifera TaxID=397392 RepID=UPI0025ADB6FD|nr:uncharacterized protein LOC131158630 [Malania oleifera]